MARYTVNEQAMAHARKLIASRQYVLRSDWGEAQSSVEDENRFLARHDWDDYSSWHLGLTDGAKDGTKARYAFVFGDVEMLNLAARRRRAGRAVALHPTFVKDEPPAPAPG